MRRLTFANLLEIKYDTDTGMIDASELAELLPATPLAIREMLSDHGRNNAFQEQYRTIEISRLNWELVELEAGDILKCSIHDDFQRWVGDVSKRVDDFGDRGWRALDKRPEVTEHWQKHGTWSSPPIFLDAALIGGKGIHLVEGHTRLGTLRGLVSAGLISARSRHVIWHGT